MKLRNNFAILLSFLCCLPSPIAAETQDHSTATTIGFTATGILVGAVICSIIAEKTKSPLEIPKKQTSAQTIWEKIRVSTVKNFNVIRTALYSLLGAITGTIVGLYAADAILSKKVPTVQDQLAELQTKQEYEQRVLINRFNNNPKRVKASFNKDEQALYFAIQNELATPFENLILEPSDQDIFKEMSERLTNKLTTKYYFLKEQLHKTMPKEQPGQTPAPETTPIPECPVCFEKPQQLTCNYLCDHALCTACFNNWAKQPGGKKCPMCRSQLK